LLLFFIFFAPFFRLHQNLHRFLQRNLYIQPTQKKLNKNPDFVWKSPNFTHKIASSFLPSLANGYAQWSLCYHPITNQKEKKKLLLLCKMMNCLGLNVLEYFIFRGNKAYTTHSPLITIKIWKRKNLWNKQSYFHFK
jgi:hypothetical protein